MAPCLNKLTFLIVCNHVLITKQIFFSMKLKVDYFTPVCLNALLKAVYDIATIVANLGNLSQNLGNFQDHLGFFGDLLLQNELAKILEFSKASQGILVKFWDLFLATMFGEIT